MEIQDGSLFLWSKVNKTSMVVDLSCWHLCEILWTTKVFFSHIEKWENCRISHFATELPPSCRSTGHPIIFLKTSFEISQTKSLFVSPTVMSSFLGAGPFTIPKTHFHGVIGMTEGNIVKTRWSLQPRRTDTGQEIYLTLPLHMNGDRLATV